MTCPTAFRLVVWDVSTDGRPATAVVGLIIGDAAIPLPDADRHVCEATGEDAHLLSAMIRIAHKCAVETAGMDANRLMTSLNSLRPRVDAPPPAAAPRKRKLK